MRIIDISMPITHNMTVYKDKVENRPKIENLRNYNNSSMYESSIWMNLHTGTHVDFPLHGIQGGQNSTNHDLKQYIGPCKVFDLSNLKNSITKEDIESLEINENDFVLFKTRNSNVEGFDYEFVYLSESGANFLVSKQVRGVGIDALGIERSQPNHETHTALLSKNIVILEGLRLKNVLEGTYQLICLPINIINVEALPVRAVLIEEK
ncbi:MAG TPA: cyclase family protein [Bacilli bacterium]|nr:cyclase family protein [Bacilli bacterium]